MIVGDLYLTFSVRNLIPRQDHGLTDYTSFLYTLGINLKIRGINSAFKAFSAVC
jgi:hypothetical protein